jgi:hypothetical protein
MQSDEQSSQNESEPLRRRFNWELYYYERIGTQYHLRITPFAIILMVVTLVISFMILFSDGYESHEKLDVRSNTMPTATQSPVHSVIKPVPLHKTKPSVNK